jgi:hypothetical protein
MVFPLAHELVNSQGDVRRSSSNGCDASLQVLDIGDKIYFDFKLQLCLIRGRALCVIRTYEIFGGNDTIDENKMWFCDVEMGIVTVKTI